MRTTPPFLPWLALTLTLALVACGDEGTTTPPRDATPPVLEVLAPAPDSVLVAGPASLSPPGRRSRVSRPPAGTAAHCARSRDGTPGPDCGRHLRGRLRAVPPHVAAWRRRRCVPSDLGHTCCRDVIYITWPSCS